MMMGGQQLSGLRVDDLSGATLGRVGQVYLDRVTGRPEWVTVQSGHPGAVETFVPIAGASVHDGTLCVPYAKDQVTGAPMLEADGTLPPTGEAQLYRYYGLERPGSGGTVVAVADGAPQRDGARLRRYLGRATG